MSLGLVIKVLVAPSGSHSVTQLLLLNSLIWNKYFFLVVCLGEAWLL